MIPIVKGWSTEVGQEVASLGVQVHGGMGFIEETGAAQHLRDARITTIYEGTTGIQANDLIGRKTARDGGAVARRSLREIDKRGRATRVRMPNRRCSAIGVRLAAARCGAAERDRLDGAGVRAATARGARGRGRLPEAVGTRGRRLADGARGADRRRQQLAAGERRRRVPAREDRHRALLRRVPSAAGRGACPSHYARERCALALDAENF